MLIPRPVGAVWVVQIGGVLSLETHTSHCSVCLKTTLCAVWGCKLATNLGSCTSHCGECSQNSIVGSVGVQRGKVLMLNAHPSHRSVCSQNQIVSNAAADVALSAAVPTGSTSCFPTENAPKSWRRVLSKQHCRLRVGCKCVKFMGGGQASSRSQKHIVGCVGVQVGKLLMLKARPSHCSVRSQNHIVGCMSVQIG